MAVNRMKTLKIKKEKKEMFKNLVYLLENIPQAT
jgi:hypothetical protein